LAVRRASSSEPKFWISEVVMKAPAPIPPSQK
jgi:hypothetical protein